MIHRTVLDGVVSMSFFFFQAGLSDFEDSGGE